MILVMRYAAEASAIPYIRTPTRGIFKKTKKTDTKAEQYAFSVLKPSTLLLFGVSDARKVGFELWYS